MRRWMNALTQSPDGLLHDNGEVCCILQICCPPGADGKATEETRAALTAHLDREMRARGAVAPSARQAADIILDSFDLAPHGSLTLLKSEITRHARKPDNGGH